MATYHCKLNKGKGSYCFQHANYILREGRYSKEVCGREDLVYKEYGNLPAWANSPQEFWKAAAAHERSNGVAYFELEIALPNELSDEENKKIVQEYVKQVVGNKPYTFAIHNKPASLNEDVKQPHAHIMFSERVAEKDVNYTKEQFFKRYNSHHPERGGAKKDTRFTAMSGKKNILEVRKTLEEIINKSYENNGMDVRISAATLQKLYNEAVAKNDVDLANFYNRAPEKHLGPEEVNKIKKGTKNLKTQEEKKVKYYFRYMDDLVIFGRTKEELHELQKEIETYFKTELKLQIKDNWQIFPSYMRGVDFLGYRTFFNYSLLRKSTCKAMKRKMTAIKKKVKNGGVISYSDQCCINSYKGWLKHCDSFRLQQKYIVPLLFRMATREKEET